MEIFRSWLREDKLNSFSDEDLLLAAERVEAKTTPVPDTGCHLWLGSVRRDGYGATSVRGITGIAVHRLVYWVRNGKIPRSSVVDHLCRVRSCCNPDHMEIVSDAENIRRGISPSAISARRTHCDKGHEFTKENTIIRSGSDGRRCRICAKNRYKRA